MPHVGPGGASVFHILKDAELEDGSSPSPEILIPKSSWHQLGNLGAVSGTQADLSQFPESCLSAICAGMHFLGQDLLGEVFHVSSEVVRHPSQDRLVACVGWA